jgi:hypothetical protein
MKKILNLKRITAAELIETGTKSYAYAESEWKRLADRYVNAQLYQRVKSPNSYPEFYAQYTTSDGLKLFAEVSVSGMLHNGGFAHCLIYDFTEDSMLKSYCLETNPEIQEDDEIVVFTKPFDFGGKLGRAEKTAENRKQLAKFGILVTDL